MAEVYVITNKINGKQYVGKTNRTTAERMKEHKEEMHQSRSFHRPLYKAFRKYGIEEFDVEIISTNLSPQEASEKEIDLINELGTFSDGYNATIGGDGKTYRLISDEDVAYIIDLYVKEKKSINSIAKMLDADQQTISRRLKDNGIEILSTQERNKNNSVFSEQMLMIDRFGKVIFQGSGFEVVDFLIENKYTKTTNKESVRRGILRVLDGTRQTYLKHTFLVE